MKAKWEVIGHISVDAGIIQIGDPCYDICPDSFDTLMAQSDAVTVPHQGSYRTRGNRNAAFVA